MDDHLWMYISLHIILQTKLKKNKQTFKQAKIWHEAGQVFLELLHDQNVDKTDLCTSSVKPFYQTEFSVPAIVLNKILIKFANWLHLGYQ